MISDGLSEAAPCRASKHEDFEGRYNAGANDKRQSEDNDEDRGHRGNGISGLEHRGGVGGAPRTSLWYRGNSDRSGFENAEHRLEWLPGELGDEESAQRLV